MFIRLHFYQNLLYIMAVDLSRQKELDVDPKTVQQIEQLNKNRCTIKKLSNSNNVESMFILTIL